MADSVLNTIGIRVTTVSMQMKRLLAAIRATIRELLGIHLARFN
eukprot:COSAG02_NODE_48858_length_331_cov_0.564655_1_plen_43_part_10